MCDFGHREVDMHINLWFKSFCNMKKNAQLFFFYRAKITKRSFRHDGKEAQLAGIPRDGNTDGNPMIGL